MTKEVIMDAFFGWVGGKRLLRETITGRFPARLGKYVEVFGGAGWCLFHKEKHAAVEVYNDINSQLVNLFRCMKYHPEAVVQETGGLLNSRELFSYFKRRDTDGMTDIQKAARYLFLIRASYGSKLSSFATRPRKVMALESFREIQKRLENVIIESRSFDNLIKIYDGPDTLFYCDPPYYGTERYYDTGEHEFGKAQHTLLRDALAAIKGKFLLSYNDCAYVRELYAGFKAEAVERQSNLASRYGKDKLYKELIITNY